MNQINICDKLWFRLNTNEHHLSQVTADFFCIKEDHISSLNFVMKTFINVVGTTSKHGNKTLFGQKTNETGCD